MAVALAFTAGMLAGVAMIAGAMALLIHPRKHRPSG
jgi:uncharacterized membrane protein